MDKNINLGLMAMLGESFSETMKEKGVDINSDFARLMDKYKDEVDPVIRMRKVMAESQRNIITHMGIIFRLNYIINSISQAKLEDGDVNWGEVNNILSENIDCEDYNMCDKIETIQDLIETRMNVIAAQMGLGAWQVHTCKDCGKKFYLNFGEVQSFISNNLNLPKRCIDCRNKRKSATTENKSNQKLYSHESKLIPITEGEDKSAMQIALERAGFKAVK